MKILSCRIISIPAVCLTSVLLLCTPSCSQPSSGSSSGSGSGSGSGNSPGASVDTSGMKLVWSDEFNTGGTKAADESGNWKYETEDTVGYGWGNNEKEIYRASDANGYVSNGTLKITALNSGGTWTSARLNSTVSLKYGVLEARIKVPSSEGTWPAFWLLPEKKGWPDTGEIDIMEHAPSSWGVGHILSSLHAKNHSGDGCVHIGDKTNASFADEFHTYSLKWTATSIAAYYDGEPAGTPYVRTDSMTSDDWPYSDGKFYILLNLAMGGTVGGTIPDDLKSATMEVDYVRIYQ